MRKNVSIFNKYRLCVQCGTCESICPVNAITVREYGRSGLLYPHIDNVLCNSCGLCFKICPVNSFSLKHDLLDNSCIAGIYSAALCDDYAQISSSGGSVSAIVKSLFINKQIDNGILTVNKKDSYGTINPTGEFIESAEAIKQARGSIYHPVALNKILKGRILKSKRFVYVGLPCHVKGLINYLTVNNIDKDNIFIIGLLCNIGRGKNATRFLIKKYANIKEEDVLSIYYRKGTYPGKLSIITNSAQVEVDFSEYMSSTFFFPPKGCLFCDDLFCRDADLSVGDPWGLVDEKKAMIVVNNIKGALLLDNAINCGLLEMERMLTKEEVLSTQNYKHKENRAIRSKIYKMLGVRIPAKVSGELSNKNGIKATPFNIFISLAYLLNSRVFNSPFYLIAGVIPSKILKVISSIVKNNLK